jgi:hypothetical protein
VADIVEDSGKRFLSKKGIRHLIWFRRPQNS